MKVLEMDYLDPRAATYKNTARDRRKADDPSYEGPERRLGRKRQKELSAILRRLEKEARRA
jgi:hypothetical protein